MTKMRGHKPNRSVGAFATTSTMTTAMQTSANPMQMRKVADRTGRCRSALVASSTMLRLVARAI